MLTWRMTDFALARQHRVPDERAFTDHNLLSLAMRCPHETRVRLFDVTQEAQTGADFEWWIGDGHLYLPLLVQAKRMDRRDAYAGLRQRVGAFGPRQIDRLIDACRVAGSDYRGHAAAYLFYNATPRTGRFPDDRCCGALVGDELRGCSVGWAPAVRHRLDASPRRGSIQVRRHAPVTRPWSCLFCCPRRQPSLAHAVRDSLTSAGDDEVSAQQPGPAVREFDQLPGYVLATIEAPDYAYRVPPLPAARVLMVTTVVAPQE